MRSITLALIGFLVVFASLWIQNARASFMYFHQGQAFASAEIDGVGSDEDMGQVGDAYSAIATFPATSTATVPSMPPTTSSWRKNGTQHGYDAWRQNFGATASGADAARARGRA